MNIYSRHRNGKDQRVGGLKEYTYILQGTKLDRKRESLMPSPQRKLRIMGTGNQRGAKRFLSNQQALQAATVL